MSLTPSGNSHGGHNSSQRAVLEIRAPSYHIAAPPTRRLSVSGSSRPTHVEVAPGHESSRHGRSTSRAPGSSSQTPSHRRSVSTTRPPAPVSASNATPASGTMLYTMGVEIETILYSKTRAPKPLWIGHTASRDAKELAKLFNGYSERNRQRSCREMLVQGDSKLRGSDKYRYWDLMQDGSIGESGTY